MLSDIDEALYSAESSKFIIGRTADALLRSGPAFAGRWQRRQTSGAICVASPDEGVRDYVVRGARQLASTSPPSFPYSARPATASAGRSIRAARRRPSAVHRSGLPARRARVCFGP